MATKNNTLSAKDGSLNNLKEKVTINGQRKLNTKSDKPLKKHPKKRRKSKEKADSIIRKQEDQCLDSPTVAIGGESFGQPIPELYPELSEDLERPIDPEEDISHQESQSAESLQNSKEQLDDSQVSSLDSQPIGIKKRRKMSVPQKIKRPDENFDMDDAEDYDLLDKPKQRTGSWVQCSLPHCGKWRCLNDKVDPNVLPDKWVCSMNPDYKYNSCGVSQEDFDSQDEDFDVIYSPYPEGAIVWAKLAGYPWWPGMMENDPDYGYYCEKEQNTRAPISYHVVFFDKDVSRAWVNTCNVRPFQADDNPEDQGSVVIRKKNFKKKLDLATEQARQALSLSPEGRIKEYGFKKRFKGPIGHQNKSSKDEKIKVAVEKTNDWDEEEGREEDEEYYVNSVESNELSGNSESFSEEFCKKTTKKIVNKKINNRKGNPNKTSKKRTKNEDCKHAPIIDPGNSNIEKLSTSTSDNPKKKSKPRKKSIHKIERTVKYTSFEQEEKRQKDTPLILNAVLEDLDTSKNSESPKSPIAPASQNAETPDQVQGNLTKENTSIAKGKNSLKPKKRKLANKKKDEQKTKGKNSRKEPKQAKNSDLKNDTTSRVQLAKKSFNKLNDKHVAQAENENKAERLEKPLVDEKSRDHVLEKKTSLKDVQTTETTSIEPSSSSLNLPNMPKLIKARFKPPSKQSAEDLKSCSKPAKMPKLWKPHFVCPTIAAEKASKILNDNKNEKRDRGEAESKNRDPSSICDGGEMCSAEVKTGVKDQHLSDEVEVELAKLDKDIEDMMKKFNDSPPIKQNEKTKLQPTGADNIVSTGDSPEF